MLLVDKKHHIKLYVDCLNQADQKRAVSILQESFPEADIYQEVSEQDYSDEFAVAEARAAYTTMSPSKMLKALRQETAMTQKHCFTVMEPAIRAQMQATRLGALA